MLEIREIVNKKEWEDFLASEKPHTFLQSWNWGEFHRLMGDKFWRLGIYNHEACSMKHEACLAGVAIVVKISARRGKFLFIPHGPIIGSKFHASGFKSLVYYLKVLAQKENCSFIRVSPLLVRNPENEKLFRDLGFRLAPIHMHAAELVWMLDISQGEEELLRGMRKTTRYLVHKAEKDGVKIVKSGKPEDLEIFNKIYDDTARRQHFTPYPRDFLENEFRAFSVSGPNIRTTDEEKDKKGEEEDLGGIGFFFAKYQNEVVSAAMIIFYGDSAYYHQGASLGKYPKIPAPYLLQWEIIKEARRRGLKYYNFWGISPENKPRHPWAGLSLFKKGFGGWSEEYVPAQDLPLKKSYWLTWFVEKARKTRRGL